VSGNKKWQEARAEQFDEWTGGNCRWFKRRICSESYREVLAGVLWEQRVPRTVWMRTKRNISRT